MDSLEAIYFVNDKEEVKGIRAVSFSDYEDYSADFERDVQVTGDDIQGIWYDEMPKGSTEIEYPIELENRIIYLVNSGEHDRSEYLIRGNFEKNETLLLDPSKKKRYFGLLKNTFFIARLNTNIQPTTIHRSTKTR